MRKIWLSGSAGAADGSGSALNEITAEGFLDYHVTASGVFARRPRVPEVFDHGREKIGRNGKVKDRFAAVAYRCSSCRSRFPRTLP